MKPNGSTIKTSWSILEKWKPVALNVLHYPLELDVLQLWPLSQPLQLQKASTITDINPATTNTKADYTENQEVILIYFHSK